MPTYQFRCPDGTIVERVFKISEVPDSIPAPDGSGEAVRIISGGAGLIFKGSGFYITDYGKDGKKAERDAAAKSESKSESKPDTKTPETTGSGTASRTESSGGSDTSGGSKSGSSSE